jgi:hypothetical protein
MSIDKKTTTFSVILEDVQQVQAMRKSSFIITNRRVETMEADDIQQAWTLARAKYYIGMASPVDQPQTQIVDIKEGEYTLPPQAERQVFVPNKDDGIDLGTRAMFGGIKS